MDQNKRKQQSTLVTIVAIWNCMVGAGLVRHPWAFSESGLIVSVLINLISLIV